MVEAFLGRLARLAALAGSGDGAAGGARGRPVGRGGAGRPARRWRASILKPLHGAEPGLAGALAATLAPGHAAPFEVLFAVRDPEDAAAAVAEAAMAAAPARAGPAGAATRGCTGRTARSPS